MFYTDGRFVIRLIFYTVPTVSDADGSGFNQMAKAIPFTFWGDDRYFMSKLLKFTGVAVDDFHSAHWNLDQAGEEKTDFHYGSGC